MAGMDGVDLVVCARELYPMLPALIVTGYGGADGLNRLPPNVQILSKPFQRNDLVRAVTALARTRSVEILH
jgi:two-component SAPR family response regulator